MKKAKIIIDILMTALMFILMGMHLTGQMWHEIAGTALFVLFVVHHNNGRPSAGDIISYAGDEHVKMSIVACHDGTLYALFAARPNVKDIYEELLAFEKELS